MEMNNLDALIKGIIPPHTREEKDALIKHLRAQLADAENLIAQINRISDVVIMGTEEGGLRARPVFELTREYLEKYK